MTTFFDNIKRSFADVKIDPEIDTVQYLEATEGLISMFDLLGSTAFSVVQKDMNGNVKKIRDRYATDPAQNETLQKLVANDEKKRTATEGLLWLNRGLAFTSVALRRSLDNNSQDFAADKAAEESTTGGEELSASFNTAYQETLAKHHSMFVKPVFSLAMKACPKRSVFYESLGGTSPEVYSKMQSWLSALEVIVARTDKFLKDGDYTKGL